MIILHGVALLLSTAVANITSVALSGQDRGTTHEMHTCGPRGPDPPGSRDSHRPRLCLWAPAASPALPASEPGVYLFGFEAAIGKPRDISACLATLTAAPEAQVPQLPKHMLMLTSHPLTNPIGNMTKISL